MQVWLRPQTAFERTPKYGITRRAQQWDSRRYFVNVEGMLVAFELLLALFNMWTIHLAWQSSNWLIALYAAIFTVGLLFNSLLTIAQAIRHRFAPQPTADPARVT
jgi:hypothetical protein